MLSLLKSALPSFLLPPQPYAVVSEDHENDSGLVPNVLSKDSDHHQIESDVDFMIFLNVVRIDGLTAIPPTLIEYALTKFSGSWQDVLREYGLELPYLNSLASINDSPPEKQLKVAAKEGYVEIVRFLFERGHVWPEKVCTIAAEHGHLEVLRYANESGAVWDSSAPAIAAKNGHTDCLHYLHKNGCRWESDTIVEASLGRIECLQYALQNKCPADKNGFALPAAISGGHLGCVLLLRKYGYSWPRNLFGDNRSKLHARIRCSEESLQSILMYALADGWMWGSSMVEELAEVGYADTLRMAISSKIVLSSEVCINAVAYGHLEALKAAVEGGSPLTPEVQFVALSGMHLDCMVYAYEQGCPWPDAIMAGYYTPYEKFLECLKFAYSHGCPIDPTTCKWAATQGFLDMLVYAHEIGCAWDATVTHELLEHLKNNNFNDAARWACLEYALLQGCPIGEADRVVYRTARGSRSPQAGAGSPRSTASLKSPRSPASPQSSAKMN